MRRTIATIVTALAIPVLLAFQITAGPMIYCPIGATIIILSDDNSTGQGRICVVKTKIVEESGCKAMATGCEKMSGGCQKVAAEVVETCAKPDATPGCASRSTGDGEQCSRQWAACCECLPVTFRLDPVFDLTAKDFDFNTLGDGAIIQTLAEADRQLSLLHAHSPPLEPPTLSGFDHCLEKCSFLL